MKQKQLFLSLLLFLISNSSLFAQGEDSTIVTVLKEDSIFIYTFDYKAYYLVNKQPDKDYLKVIYEFDESEEMVEMKLSYLMVNHKISNILKLDFHLDHVRSYGNKKWSHYEKGFQLFNETNNEELFSIVYDVIKGEQETHLDSTGNVISDRKTSCGFTFDYEIDDFGNIILSHLKLHSIGCSYVTGFKTGKYVLKEGNYVFQAQ